MRIDVTQEDIDQGEPGECGKCPVALALHRATGDQWIVSDEMCWIHESGKQMSDLPYEAQQFIDSFDRRGPVAPFSFELDIEPGKEG